MGFETEQKAAGGCGGLMLLVWAYFIICWIVNLIKLINCDFDAPWRDEIIHAIGVFTVFGSGITVWF